MPVTPYDPPPFEEPAVNPYEAPKAEIGPHGLSTSDLEGLASGQRLVIYAIFTCFLCIVVDVGAVGLAIVMPTAQQNVAIFLLNGVAVLSLIGFVVSFVMGLVGFFKMAAGLRIHLVFQVLLVFPIMLPFVGIIILLIMSAKATRRLREADYQAGILEAKRRLGAV